MQEKLSRFSTIQTSLHPWLKAAQTNAVLMCALEEILPEFDLNHLKGDGRFDEKGLNSIDIASLVCSVEDLLKCNISNEEYQQFYTIEGARMVIARNLMLSAELIDSSVRISDVQPGWKTFVQLMVSKFHNSPGKFLSRQRSLQRSVAG